MQAITEHSKILDKLFQGYYWIVIMRLDNKFMKQLHRRLKFNIVEKGGEMEDIVKASFPKANANDFLYFSKRI